jgi:3-methyladenine DNA glycosylase AlkC
MPSAAEPFKNRIDAALVRNLARTLAAPGFDARRFEALATQGLDALELKARVDLVCAALEATLPEDFEAAAERLQAALTELDGWVLWPVGEYVARRGLRQPGLALQLLHGLTQRFSAEFAIRPFIVEHPELVFTTLQRWARDPNEHVRRLVSEGSRPRLPWGLRLQALVRDPAPTLPLLLALQDDPSEYVRRSVANHLNDIAKDHPERVADWLEAHLPGASAERRRLLRHASRTLIKQGHRRVLSAWGLGQALRGSATLALKPARVTLGGSLALSVTLVSTSPKAQRLAVDYAVHHVKADGRTTPKVFKGWVVELPAHGTLTLQKTHSMRVITTRRYHAGRHAIEVQANGRSVAEAAFTLRLPAA